MDMISTQPTAITLETRSTLLQDACPEGADYLGSHPTLEAAYSSCSDPSWLCWSFEKLGLKDDPRLRDAAREIALSVFEKHFSRNDPKVVVVFKWLDSGEESLRGAACATADAAARVAASAAACATDAADAAARVAACAAFAAAHATLSAARAAADAARSAACDVIRKHMPFGSF